MVVAQRVKKVATDGASSSFGITNALGLMGRFSSAGTGNGGFRPHDQGRC
jgi:hypothetical protein